MTEKNFEQDFELLKYLMVWKGFSSEDLEIKIKPFLYKELMKAKHLDRLSGNFIWVEIKKHYPESSTVIRKIGHLFDEIIAKRGE